MTSLSSHLRPAPYPYGLLTLRLLGKLGGKNRRFLREEMSLPVKMPPENESPLTVACDWSADPENGDRFSLSLPLVRSVALLKALALGKDSSEPLEEEDILEGDLSWDEYERLATEHPENINLVSYCRGAVEDVEQETARAAFAVLRSSLVNIVDISSCNDVAAATELETSIAADDGSSEVENSNESSKRADASASTSFDTVSDKERRNRFVLCLCEGLFYASVLDVTSDEARGLLKGIALTSLLSIVSLQRYVIRIDGNGSPLVDEEELAEDSEEKTGQRGILRRPERAAPFGYFHLTGPFEGKSDPFLVNRAIAQGLCTGSPTLAKFGLDLISDVLSLSDSAKVRDSSAYRDGRDLYIENLLRELCEISVSSPWNRRTGAWDALCLLMDKLGSEWCRCYELEIIHVAIAAMKAAPREIASAAIQAFHFFHRICNRMYESTPSMNESKVICDALTDDCLSEKESSADDMPDNSSADEEERWKTSSPSDAVLRMLMTELTSTDAILRSVAIFGEGFVK